MLAVLAACVHQSPLPGRSFAGQADDTEAAVSGVIMAALEAEAEGRNADSLYLGTAIIVLNGRTRPGPPRLAGVGTGGTVAISSSQLTIRSGLAWALVEYRWDSREGITREGRATFVLRPGGDGGWRIEHLHSSSPR